MAIFGLKPWVHPVEKNVNFSPFSTSCFYSLKRRFFLLEYHIRHLLGLYCLKKQSWKNVNFSTVSTSCFYSLERRFFLLEYCKRYLPGPYCVKKKVGKMAIFGQKPWVNPFGKISIFRLFQLLLFIA